MEKIKTILIGIFSIMALNLMSQNQSSTSSTSANIIQPISISKTDDLRFGNIVALSTDESVTIDSDGIRTSSNSLSLPTATPGNISSAKFNVSGLNGATYSIVLPTSFNVTNGSNNMLVHTILSNPTSTGILINGTQEISVGATINVSANQATGLYINDNSLVVTVAYN